MKECEKVGAKLPESTEPDTEITKGALGEARDYRHLPYENDPMSNYRRRPKRRELKTTRGFGFTPA